VVIEKETGYPYKISKDYLELIILMNTLNGPNNNGLYEVLG
jgi:hypothetical protein